jgi:hypothetical protein
MFKRVIELRKQLDEEIKRCGKQEFYEVFEKFFTEDPELEAITWTQGTPAWNDGDPCVFSANCYDPFVYDGESHYEMKDKELGKQFYDLFSSIPEEIFEGVFGDGVQVTVSRDGIVSWDEYDPY